MSLPGTATVRRFVAWLVDVAVTVVAAFVTLLVLQQFVLPATPYHVGPNMVVIVSVIVGLIVARLSRPVVSGTVR